MKTGLLKLLIGENTINSIVADRIYLRRTPQNADTSKEHIVITQMSSEENNSLDGTSELRFLDFDIDCKAPTAARADTLAAAVRVFLDDYTGAAGDQTVGAVIYSGESDGYEEPADGSERGIFTTSLDFQIQYVPS